MSTLAHPPGTEASSKVEITPHTLPFTDAPSFFISNVDRRPLSKDWAKESEKNAKAAEKRVRNYYIKYGVCPPTFPSGARKVPGGLYGQGGEGIGGISSVEGLENPIWCYEPSNGPDGNGGWLRIWSQKNRNPYRAYRITEYDTAQATNSRAAIRTVWEGAPHISDSEEDTDQDDEIDGNDIQDRGDEEEQSEVLEDEGVEQHVQSTASRKAEKSKAPEQSEETASHAFSISMDLFTNIHLIDERY
ncbi:hypothetical protein P154DRAFT_579357 [Amniculicola lignicola CBS 123094]|uniref:Uncharacterized protein n=1 Tax=Amniculicola lignicola CBS 123094 TaxID=1392246 RepID=A0A6A5W8E6_9PLEO|nr:hypothetical protein P154DRAFT_579357 [Amniculicola lignicola CBS 123094]